MDCLPTDQANQTIDLGKSGLLWIFGSSYRKLLKRTASSNAGRLPLALPSALSLYLALLGFGADGSIQAVATTITSEHKQGAAAAGDSKMTVSLTPAEKEIARKLEFDEKVLLLLKQTLNPEIGVVKEGGLEGSDDSFFSEKLYTMPELLEEDRQNYEQIARDFPELRKAVEWELNRHDKNASSKALQSILPERKQISPEKQRRVERYGAALAEVEALLIQEIKEGLEKNKSY